MAGVGAGVDARTTAGQETGGATGLPPQRIQIIRWGPRAGARRYRRETSGTSYLAGLAGAGVDAGAVLMPWVTEWVNPGPPLARTNRTTSEMDVHMKMTA